MSDLISRSELLKLFPVDMGNPLWHFTGIRAAIEAAPTIDAVPVVRCKECLYGTPTYGENYIRCAIWGEDIKNGEYCYCYCGKRRVVKTHD